MPEFGICTLSCIAGRQKAGDSAEMSHQLLFGEPYAVVNKAEKWVEVQTLWDDYNCWIDGKQHFTVTEATARAVYKEENLNRCGVQVGHAYNREGLHVLIPLGSPLPGFNGGNFQLSSESWTFHGEVAGKDPAYMAAYAYRLLGTPYLWGGRSSFGLDCSGFVQVIFSLAGIRLPRDAWQQASAGRHVAFGQQKLNDLVFFKNAQGRIMHVGIMADEQKIIHASGQVRIDTLTQHGIVNQAGELTHNFHSIVRP